MRIFEGFNQTGKPCPLCGLNTNKQCVLVPIDGTERGNIMKAEAIHVDCLELIMIDLPNGKKLICHGV